MKIIDAHNHPDWHGHDLEKSLENMNRFGIEKTWLLSWEGPADNYSHSYNQVLHDIYGAQVCGEFKVRMMYDNPDALMLFQVAGELKMPVTFHLQYDPRKRWDDPREEWYGGTIDTVERMLQACTGTVFLGHAPGFWIHISGDDLYRTKDYPALTDPVLPGGRIPELLRKYPNLYCDISSGSGRYALSRDLDFTRKFLIEFHDRVLYARDFFDNKHQELLNSLGLPENVLEDIYFRNAERLLAQ